MLYKVFIRKSGNFLFFILGKCCHFWATQKFVVTLLLFGEIFEKIVINKCYIYFGMFIAYLPTSKKKFEKNITKLTTI